MMAGMLLGGALLIGFFGLLAVGVLLLVLHEERRQERGGMIEGVRWIEMNRPPLWGPGRYQDSRIRPLDLPWRCPACGFTLAGTPVAPPCPNDGLALVEAGA